MADPHRVRARLRALLSPLISNHVPRPLGSSFTRLWLATAVSNIGNGMTRAAGPLLVLTLSTDPAAVAGAGIAQQLPWLLATLPAGVLIDRVDRRRLLAGLNLTRGMAIGGVAGAVATGQATLPLLYTALVVLGIGEVAADNGAAALLPSLVDEADLERANSRLTAVFVVGDQLLAPPLGATLFILAAALPFGVDAVSFVVAALLIRSLRLPPRQLSTETLPTDARRSVRHDLSEGLSTLWRQPTLRLLAVLLGVMNVVFGMGFAVYVLYATQQLGLDETGFGLLLSAGAAGGLVGSGTAARIRRRFTIPVILRAGLVIETATHLLLATTRHAWIAGAVMAIFGIHAIVWGVVTISLRQRLTPDQLLGRVGSAYQLLAVGGTVVGTLTGGIVAEQTGVAAPFWSAGAAMAVVTAAAWRPLASIKSSHGD